MLQKKLQSLSTDELQKLLTLVSMIITCQVIYIQHGWINDDSVLYFEVARLFSLGEWKEGVTLFNWPFYPALISFTHQLSTLSIQTSAQLLNVIFFGITTYSFINLIKLAGGDKVTVISGTFLLLSSSYIVGDVLPMLLRDQGFWAMFLSSLVYFIKFYRHQKMSDGLLWQACGIIAVLFRVEAITFLACLPFVLFLASDLSIERKIRNFLTINLIPILLLGTIIATLIILPNVHLSSFGRLQEIVSIFPRMMTEVAGKFSSRATIMGEQVLGSYLSEYGMTGIIVSLICILILKIVGLVSWPVIGILALNRANCHQEIDTAKMRRDSIIIFFWVSVLAILNASVILTSAFVLSSRYIIALAFIVLIFSAFHLESLVKKIPMKISWQKVLFYIFIAAISFTFIKNILPKQAGYTFEQDAIAYIKQQNIPENEVFYVTPRSRYFASAPYAGRGYEYWDFIKKAIDDGSIYHYNYLVINLDIDDKFNSRKNMLDERLPQYRVEKEFYGYKNKKKIMLYIKLKT